MASSTFHAFCHRERESRRRREGAAAPSGGLAPVPGRIDNRVFNPLIEQIAKGGCGLDEAGMEFQRSVYPAMERHRGTPHKGIMNQYAGFLFETFIQLSLARFSERSKGLLHILRNAAGMLHDGSTYSVNARGSAVFQRPEEGGARKLAEIDSICEYTEAKGITPVIFEITLRDPRLHKDFRSRRKARLVEGIYGSSPHFCIIRPAYGEERPGVYQRFSREMGAWRDLLVPKNDGLIALASKLFELERGQRAFAQNGGRP